MGPRYFLDIPHHWEGWVVGEGLGELSHDGDTDCPVGSLQMIILTCLLNFVLSNILIFCLVETFKNSGKCFVRNESFCCLG